MDKPAILHILSPLPHVSPFDITMAYDAGFDAVVPYPDVKAGGNSRGGQRIDIHDDTAALLRQLTADAGVK